MQPLTSNRILAVDALRGFALLGIFLAHMITWYSVGPLPANLFSHLSIISSIVYKVNDLFISGKFFALFSFLFGFGFFIQLQSLEKKTGNPVFRYGWKIILLGVIGMVHAMFWQSDILTIYAILAFFLFPVSKRSNRLILFLGILLAINIPGRLIELVYSLIAKSGNQHTGYWKSPSRSYYDTIIHANWIELFRFNRNSWSDKIRFQIVSGRIFVTYGFFLMGIFTGRMGWFTNLQSAKETIKKIFKYSFRIILVAVVLRKTAIVLDEAYTLGWQENVFGEFFITIFFNIRTAAMVCLYISGFTLLMYQPSWQNRLAPFSKVGKMAITCYLSQTVFGLFLYYHVGLGLFGKTSLWENWLITILLFILQLVFCQLWLRKLHFGPIEWLWRSFTYFKWQPLLKTENTQILNQ